MRSKKNQKGGAGKKSYLSKSKNKNSNTKKSLKQLIKDISPKGIKYLRIILCFY